MKTEADVKKKLKAELKNLPAFWWHFMPVSLGMGVHGVPDFVCCYRGQFVAIETKRPGRRNEKSEGLSALQVKVRDQIHSAGGKYFLVDDKDTIEDVLYWIHNIEEAIEEARNENEGPN
jgi:hypothetical protein